MVPRKYLLELSWWYPNQRYKSCSSGTQIRGTKVILAVPKSEVQSYSSDTLIKGTNSTLGYPYFRYKWFYKLELQLYAVVTQWSDVVDYWGYVTGSSRLLKGYELSKC